MFQGNEMTRLVTKVLTALASRTASLTATGVLITDLEGVVQFHLRHKDLSGTSPTWAWSVEDSDDDSSYAAVTGLSVAAAANTDTKIAIDRAKLRKYVRVVGTIGGSATPTLATCADVRGFAKYAA